jgi:glycosyltransferase involved in cell wall biosynthesis
VPHTTDVEAAQSCAGACFNSTAEAVSLVVVATLATGVPAIASARGSVPQLVGDGVTALSPIVSTRRSRALASWISRCHGASERRLTANDGE